MPFLVRHRAAIAGLALLVFPLVMPFTAVATDIVIYVLFALGFNLLYGYLGLLSFGHAALFGAGAYACGIALVRLGLPWYLDILLAVLAGVLVAGVIGMLAARTRGIYFAMVTLALAECLYYLAYEATDITGGENGLRGVDLRWIDLFGMRLNFVDPLVLFLLSRILASPFGAAIEAIRENEARARACGYNVRAMRLLAFLISGAVSGLAGALQALHLSIVSVQTLDYPVSGLVVMMCLLGGAGTFLGPFVGAGVYLLLEELVSLVSTHWQLPVGVTFVACVLFFPRGIWGTLTALTMRAPR
jgi:branched-chain amino acid transport system permease protein